MPSKSFTAFFRCGKKVRYKSYQEAESARLRLKRKHGYPLNLYHCQLCGGFHIGHIKQEE